MLFLALTLAVSAAPIGLDVDVVGLSPLERSAIEERTRSELADLAPKDAPGLVACGEDAACLRDALARISAAGGATVRVVKVLQVVRVDVLVVDADGRVVRRAENTVDVEEVARGALLGPDTIAALRALSPPVPAPVPPEDAASTPAASPFRVSPALAWGGLVGGGIVAVTASAIAVHEAVVANSAASSGAEKERARVLGPVAAIMAGGGLLGAAASAAALLLLPSDPADPQGTDPPFEPEG